MFTLLLYIDRCGFVLFTYLLGISCINILQGPCQSDGRREERKSESSSSGGRKIPAKKFGLLQKLKIVIEISGTCSSHIVLILQVKVL